MTLPGRRGISPHAKRNPRQHDLPTMFVMERRIAGRMLLIDEVRNEPAFGGRDGFNGDGCPVLVAEESARPEKHGRGDDGQGAFHVSPAQALGLPSKS
jgi:hypothetical protein